MLRLVLRQGMGLTLLGLAAGVAGAAFLTRYLSSLLFQTPPLDPATFAGAAAIILLAGLLSGFRRGARSPWIRCGCCGASRPSSQDLFSGDKLSEARIGAQPSNAAIDCEASPRVSSCGAR